MKYYQEPELEICKFDVQDIISTSDRDEIFDKVSSEFPITEV